MDWQQRLDELIPLFGHRNWIVIADSALPAPVGAVEVLATGWPMPQLLQHVLVAVDAAPHLAPWAYLDSELEHLTEDLAPGIEDMLGDLDTLLAHVPVRMLPHAEILARMGEVASQYRILVLKSTCTLPYTSVFLELDCGYWGPEQERALRERMDAAAV